MSDISLNDDIIYLRGEVTVATVTPLSQQLQQWDLAQVNTLDCNGVTTVDSSIVALLLAALALAKTLDSHLTIAQLPEPVSRLIKLYDLEAVIGPVPHTRAES